MHRMPFVKRHAKSGISAPICLKVFIFGARLKTCPTRRSTWLKIDDIYIYIDVGKQYVHIYAYVRI